MPLPTQKAPKTRDAEEFLKFFDKVFGDDGAKSSTYQRIKDHERFIMKSQRVCFMLTEWSVLKGNIVGQLRELGFARLEDLSSLLASDVGMLLWVFELRRDLDLSADTAHILRHSVDMSYSDLCAILDAVRKPPFLKEPLSFACLNSKFPDHTDEITDLNNTLESVRQRKEESGPKRDEVSEICDVMDRDSDIKEALKDRGLITIECMLNGKNNLLLEEWLCEIGYGNLFKRVEFLTELRRLKIIMRLSTCIGLSRDQQFEFWAEQKSRKEERNKQKSQKRKRNEA
jgi:hypothetical protein